VFPPLKSYPAGWSLVALVPEGEGMAFLLSSFPPNDLTQPDPAGHPVVQRGQGRATFDMAFLFFASAILPPALLQCVPGF